MPSVHTLLFATDISMNASHELNRTGDVSRFEPMFADRLAIDLMVFVVGPGLVDRALEEALEAR